MGTLDAPLAIAALSEGLRSQVPHDPASAATALAPRCPPSLRSLTMGLRIKRIVSLRPVMAQAQAALEQVQIPVIVTHFFPGRWEARPDTARHARRGLMRWVVTLLREAALFPVLDDGWLDVVEEEQDLMGEDSFYEWYIPAEGGYPYAWSGVDGGSDDLPCVAETLLYVICGNPTDDEEYEGNPVSDALARLRQALTRPDLSRFARRVRVLVRAALATSRRYSTSDGLAGFDHALVEDLGSIFAQCDPPLAGVPTLARVMARSTGSCFLDVDTLSWSEMGYDSMPWTIANVEAFAAEWTTGNAILDVAYEQTLHPLREDAATFAALLAALEGTLTHYRAYATAHGEPDPAACTGSPLPLSHRRRLRGHRRVS